VSKRHRGSEPAGDVVLPITPMLDMAFQLLTFFIFTFKPTTMEGQMALSLPDQEVRADPNPDPTAKPNPNQVPTPKLELLVLVKPHALGGESPITVEAESVRTPIADLTALKAHLKEVFDRKKAAIEVEVSALPDGEQAARRKELVAELGVKVQPVSAVKWGQVVEVMDLARSVGFTSVSFAKPPDYSL